METTNPLAVRQAAVLDLLRNGADIGTAAKAAGVAVRTVHTWAEKCPEFAALKADAMLNRGRVVTEGQLDAWQQELAALRAGVDQIHADLLEQAAPALAGDAPAQARQAELREHLRVTEEQIAALTLAVQSAEQHLARAREQEAQAAREAAAVEADGLGEQQRAAAERIDAALRTIEAAWVEFDRLAKMRQSAARRAGANARPAYVRMLIAAAFACAPSTATALNLDPVYRPRSRPLRDTLN